MLFYPNKNSEQATHVYLLLRRDTTDRAEPPTRQHRAYLLKSTAAASPMEKERKEEGSGSGPDDRPGEL